MFTNFTSLRNDANTLDDPGRRTLCGEDPLEQSTVVYDTPLDFVKFEPERKSLLHLYVSGRVF
jgi:hypothetical protein